MLERSVVNTSKAITQATEIHQ